MNAPGDKSLASIFRVEAAKRKKGLQFAPKGVVLRLLPLIAAPRIRYQYVIICGGGVALLSFILLGLCSLNSRSLIHFDWIAHNFGVKHGRLRVPQIWLLMLVCNHTVLAHLILVLLCLQTLFLLH